VYPESPNRCRCRYLSCHAWACWRLRGLMEYFTSWVTERYLLTPHRRCRKSCQASVTPLKATGADWLQSRSLRPLQRFRSKLLATGSSGEPFDRYICLPRDTSRGRCLTKTRLMQSIRLIFCICHTIASTAALKFALTVVDVASRYKEAEPLTDKSATEVAAALGRIYKRGPLTWPRLLQVDPGREFMGAFSQLLAKHNVQVRRGAADNHRQQGIVELFNRTLAERLFGHQYAQEMLLAARGSSERSIDG